MTTVSFREYERISIVPKLSDPARQEITTAECEALERLSTRLDIPIIRYLSSSSVQPRQYVGAVQLGERTLEFLPKIERQDGAEVELHAVRDNLLEMLLLAFDLNGVTPGAAPLRERKAGWLDQLIRLFCIALAEQIRRGLIKRYRVEQDDLPTVRGRILVDEQIRRNLVHQERMACEYDEFDENHALNQVFRATLVRMLQAASTTATQQAVRELLPAFDAVAHVHPTIDWLKQVTLNRMSERYSMCLGLAKLFLRGSTSDLYGGPQDSFALLFDMNALFELYIGKVIRRTLRPLGHDVRLQHAQHHLVRDTTTKDKLFQLRPDIVVFCSGKCCCVVDTKWKQLKVAERKLGVLQADLYQMLAYAQRYDCNAVLLLYPLGAYSADHLSVRKQFATEHGTALITIGEVSLQDLKTVPEQLLELFAAAVAVQHVERSAAAP